MADMGRQRGISHGPTTRPRHFRIAAAAVSVFVTLVAVIGATGVLPIDATSEPALAGTVAAQADSAGETKVSTVTLKDWFSESLPLLSEFRVPVASKPAPDELPKHSGKGKRIVFDIADQRVWLVSDKEKVRRTYPVSGSLTDNLGPGAYEVYSKSRNAVGIDNSGTMRYMVRFTQGENAAIGFHDIPLHDGEKVQTRRQLGTPQSHGCIRQLREDAKALWQFAPVGTAVVVLE